MEDNRYSNNECEEADTPSFPLATLRNNQYALAISPGFFRFYALIGVLHALEDFQCLQPTHVSGASAGALVGGFLAAGISPTEMIERVLKIRREDIWDTLGNGGLLKGQLFQKLLESQLPVSKIEECNFPVGITAWELFGCKTKLIQQGCLATAIRASCTFPGLFQPVNVGGAMCIDGGVFDHVGLMALPGLPESNWIVNIICESYRLPSSKLPENMAHAKLLTIVLDNVPMVSPFTMDTMGPVAYKIARIATTRALRNSHVQQMSPNHYCWFIDAANINGSEEVSLPMPISSQSNKRHIEKEKQTFNDDTNDSKLVDDHADNQPNRASKSRTKKKRVA